MESNDPVDHMMDINDNLHQQIARLRAEKIELQTELQTTKDELAAMTHSRDYPRKVIAVYRKHQKRQRRIDMDIRAYWAQLLNKIYPYAVIANSPEPLDAADYDKHMDEAQTALESSQYLLDHKITPREEALKETEESLAHIQKQIEEWGLDEISDEEG